jgi:sulfatase modifying factor 1
MLAALLLAAALQPGMARIAGGEFKPLYALPGQPIVRVTAFAIDTIPVSEAQFATFARQHSQWSFAGMGNSASRAATGMSWHAADAYCRSRKGRLPTTYEWEYVARADERERDATPSHRFRQRLLQLAMRTERYGVSATCMA